MTTVTVVEDEITLNLYDGASPASVADVASDLSDHEALSTTAHGGIVADSDSRLADARTPTDHAASHATGEDDPIAAADIGAEPGLGNPSTDDYILSSTIAGVRSWVSGGGGDVEEAPEDETPYSRQDGGWVAALRTSIANTWSAVQTFSAGIVTGIIKPSVNATDAIEIQDAGGTAVVTVDTTNRNIEVDGNQIGLTGVNPRLYFTASNGTGVGVFQATGSTISQGSYSSSPVNFVYGNSAKMRMNATGIRIGDGTNPGASLDVGGSAIFNGNLDLDGIPTADPVHAGRVWNDGGTLKISAG